MAAFGLNVEQLEQVRQTLRNALGADRKTYVFGSRARGDHRPFSDLDLLIEGPLDVALKGRLNEAFDLSPLPFKVDLVFESELVDAYRPGVMKDRVIF